MWQSVISIAWETWIRVFRVQDSTITTIVQMRLFRLYCVCVFIVYLKNNNQRQLIVSAIDLKDR